MGVGLQVLREREMPLLATLCWLLLTFEATLGQSLTGTAGEAVSLSCGSNSGCTWSKDGVELVLEDRSDQARYSFGSSCSLTIEPLLPGDEGELIFLQGYVPVGAQIVMKRAHSYRHF